MNNLEPVAIIGGGLGGLATALHLAAAGRRVRLFEANPTLGGRANCLERDGFRFDTGPSLLNYPWVFEELFAAAGRRLADYVELLLVDPSVSFLWPDGTRLQLSSDFARLSEECERLSPGSRPGLTAFFADAAEKYRIAFDKLVSKNVESALGWFGSLAPAELARVTVWRSLDAELGRFFESRHLREALGSYGMYLGGSPFTLPGFFSILPYGEMAFGLWLPKGGIYGLVQGLERLLRELGVEIELGTRVERIEVEGGRVRGLLLADGRREAFRQIVSNLDVPTTDLQLLAPGVAPRRKRRAGKLAMTPGVLTFYWGLTRRLEALPHHTIFLPADYRGSFDELMTGRRIPRDLPFYVSSASETDPTLAPPGCSSVFVLVPTPVLSELGPIDWDAQVATVKGQVLARLAHHGVALAPSEIQVEEVWTPVEWGRRFGLHDGSAFGASHGLFQLGPFRPANVNAEVGGLYYAGASTVPGTGMPMVVLSGRQAAERVLAEGGR